MASSEWASLECVSDRRVDYSGDGVTSLESLLIPVTDPNDRQPDAPGPVGPYRVETLAGPERGVRVGCERHDEYQEFEPGRRSVVFYCPECSMEVELTLHDDLDWRDWGERC